MRVLIAEDDAVSRRLVERALSKLGHDVIAAADGRLAWEAFRKEPFSLVVSDWMMPMLDGLELCRLVRAENRRKYTYIILLTVLGGKGSYLEGMRAGADDFLTKPLDAELLQSRLQVAQRVLKLQAEVSQLLELLPICSYCRRIRDEAGGWSPIEEYLAARTQTRFSHGICSDCYQKVVLPEIAGR